MKIDKILNNNVVITMDEKNNEIVAMGRGIAFKKKIGDKLNSDEIDRVYRLENSDISLKFQELLEDLPIEYLELSNQIVEYAGEKLQRSISDSIYISLPDHMHSAIERAKKGIVVKNVLLWDIKRFFPDEYAIGKEALIKIKEKFDIDLPDDEAGFMALHLVNAQTDNAENGDMTKLTKTMQEIINIVKYYFKMEFDEDSVYFYRFTTHLRFFISRIQTDNAHSGETDEELLEIVKLKYRNAYHCVKKIMQFLYQNYSYSMSSDESLYLTIHIARLVQKNS